MLSRRLSGTVVRDESEHPTSNGHEYVNSPKKLNRSLTICEGSDGDIKKYHVKQSHKPSSPLRRFSNAKEAISHAFQLVQNCLVDSQKFFSRVQSDARSPPVNDLVRRVDGITEILNKDHMKVVFFGRTSNGKSTVINGLLKDKVLPAGIGHTTNCFCSVVGVDESEGYLIPPRSKEKMNVKNVKQLAHSLHKEHLDSNSLVEIFWPKAKCPLLNGEVELMDSPGIDMNPNLDQWISKYCLDADVFVLVSNAESTLMTAEKKFFHRVSERLSKPNIFILNNRWDCSAQEEPDMMAEVMKQHLDADVKFLADELAVVDEETARNRVFFVSAKEVLHVRTEQSSGTVAEEQFHGLADGWKKRLMAFERFEELFKQCISSTAILTKFERHYKQGCEVVQELEQLLGQEMEDLSQQCVGVRKEKSDKCEQRKILESEGQKVQERCQSKSQGTIKDVEEKLKAAIKDTRNQLPDLVKRFEEEFSEEEEKLDHYKQALFQFMDEELSKLLELTTTSLPSLHQEMETYIVEEYQSLLRLPDADVKRFFQPTNPPPLNFTFKCAQLCEDFNPDPRFSFFRSLGFSGNWLRDKFRFESAVGGVYSQLSRMWSLVPTEYAVPMVLLSGAFMLPRVFSYKVWLISLGAYASLYTWKWSTHRPVKAVKDQFVAHMVSKLEGPQTQATCNNYKSQVKSNLDNLQARLQGALESNKLETNETINQLTEKALNLENLRNQAKALKNSVHFLREDFEKFKDDHLVITDAI